jgi:hypothetical protein
MYLPKEGVHESDMEFDPVVFSLHEAGLHKPVTKKPLHFRARNTEGQVKK